MAKGLLLPVELEDIAVVVTFRLFVLFLLLFRDLMVSLLREIGRA